MESWWGIYTGSTLWKNSNTAFISRKTKGQEGSPPTHTSNLGLPSTEDIASIGNLVDRVGYKLTSFTEKEIVEEFDDLFHLMDYLSSTGLSFAGNNARDTVLKDLFIATAALYKGYYGKEYQATEYELSRPP